MTETYTCPADGCEYSGPRSSVLGHYSGKQDDAHAGGYERARVLLDDDSGTETPSQTTQTTSGSNPVHDHPPAETSGSGQSGGENVDCPHCGHSLGVTEEQARQLIDDGHDTCGSCGGTIAYE
jgi:hypothetical protein